MRPLKSKTTLAPHAARRPRRDDDAAISLGAEPEPRNGNTANDDSDIASTAAEPSIAAYAADDIGAHASGTVPDEMAAGGALPQAQSLKAAGVGLGVFGLLGAVAVGSSTKTHAVPASTPVSPGRDQVPATFLPPAGTAASDRTGIPVEPVEPIATATSIKPVEPIAPETSVKPVEPIAPETPVKAVEPIAPETPVKPAVAIAPETPVEPVVSIAPETPVKAVAPQPAGFSLSDAHVIEATTGTRELVFLVQRSGDTRQGGSVRFAVQTDKSTVSMDELTGDQAGLVSFKPGESQQLIRLPIKGDYLRETDEQVSIKLSEPVGGTLDRAEGIGTIHEVDVQRLQAAYGMRDLNAGLEGHAIRVRRSSDNEEMDIGFDVHGHVDREALLDFVGREATDKGYVTRWYDQSGHSRDMETKAPERQGVVVDGGTIITRPDGSVAISFNAGRNGDPDDHMTANGVAGSDWRSAVIYATVQSEGSRLGSLFNLGGADKDRLSVHFPDSFRKIVFDVGDPATFGRLAKEFDGSIGNLVFEAHNDSESAGTEALNYTDAARVIFGNGSWLASKNPLEERRLSTDDSWSLASHGHGVDFPQQAMYNEFLVYLAKDHSTPRVQNLIGTAQDDVLTYSDETDLKRIDGLAGEDTLYVSGTAVLDLTQFSGGIKDIEQFWLDNGERNLVILSHATVEALDTKTLAIRLDSKDVVFLGNEDISRKEVLRERLQELNPAVKFNVLIDGQAVI